MKANFLYGEFGVHCHRCDASALVKVHGILDLDQVADAVEEQAEIEHGWKEGYCPDCQKWLEPEAA